MATALDDEPVTASDKLGEIQKVLDYLKQEDKMERLSYGEIVSIEELYEIAKEYV